MEDEEIDKPVEGNPKGGSTTGEKENPRTALPEYDPNLPFKEPANREEKWISTLGSAALESKSASSIAGTNFSISSAGKDLYTPVDLAKGIPDQYEREKFISDHGSRMVQLLDPNKYGIRFNRELSDYAAFREKNYKTETKKFLDELDENQGFLDAAWRTVAKAAGSLALNVGGLVPLVYGLGAGLFTWDSKNIFNNTLFDAWDYMQEGLDKHTVVYGGSEYHSGNKNVFARFITNPMKSLNADIVPAAAFVAGAVATEMVAAAAAPLTGGASLIGNTARLGALATRTFAKSARVIRGLDQLSDFENMRKIASLTQKYRATLGTATTMVRTAGYESSLIARSTYDLTLSKAKENYINNKKGQLAASGYTDEQIEQITSDPNFISGTDLAKMQKSAEDASELAWFTNIPLVGFSNMIQFSKVFASGYKINRAISRLNPLKMTGVVKEGGKFAAKAETMGTARRLAGYTTVGLKTGVVEGFEEYAQGVIEQGYSDYWSSRFSEDSVKQSVDFMDAMTKAARNYGGSVEGFDSMTIGFLMGMLGVRLPVKFDAQTGKLTRGWESYGGVRQEFKELKKQIEKDKATAEKLNDAPINPMLKAQFENLSRNFAIQSDMEEALKNGDLFTYKNKEYEQFHSYVATRHKMGVSDTIFQDLEEFEKMDLAEFNKQFATPEVHEFSEESRKASLEKAREAAKNIIDAHERVDTAFEDTKMAADFARKNFKGVTDPFGLTDALREQMTFLYGATLNQTKREKELEGQVRDLTQGKISPSIVNSILSEITGVSKEGDANFATQARELYNAALNEWKESDPTSYNLYRKQVEPLLQDLILIKQYKSKISKMYDVLFTNKGATQFMSIYEQLAKNAAELAQEEAIKKKEEEQKNARSSNQAAKTNADLKSLGADDKIDARLASEAQLADQLLSEMLLNSDPDAANTQDLSTLINNVDTDTIISTLQRTPALFKAILERLEKQNKLIPGLNNIDQLPEILAEDPMAGARIAGALNEILTELKNNQPAKSTAAPLNYVDPADHLQPAPSVEAATSLEDIYNTKSEELKKQGIFQPGTNVTEFSIIPITHDKLIDRATGKVVRNDETGKFEVWADSTGLPSDHPTDTKKINSPDFLNNSDLTENNREATFKIADNEWNKEARDAKDIAIDVYHGDTFIGRLPAWREGMPVHLLALRQAVVSQEVGLSVAEELGEVTESAEEIQEQIKAREAKLTAKIADIQDFFNNLTGIKKLAQGNKLEVALQEARDEAAKDIQALKEKLANLSPEVNPELEAKKAELENAEDEQRRLINERNNDATVRKAIKDSNSGVITIEQLDQAINVWNFKNGLLDLTLKIDRLKSEIKSLEAKKAEIERKTTKVISLKIVEKGNRKGQTETVTQTNYTEDVEGTLVSVTEYEAKIGDTKVTLGGRRMTFKEFKEEFPLDEDYEEILGDWPDLNDDTIITVRKVKRTPSSSRFKTVVSIFSPVLGDKMDITIKKDDTKYNEELAALEGTTTSTTEANAAKVAELRAAEKIENAKIEARKKAELAIYETIQLNRRATPINPKNNVYSLREVIDQLVKANLISRGQNKTLEKQKDHYLKILETLSPFVQELPIEIISNAKGDIGGAAFSEIVTLNKKGQGFNLQVLVHEVIHSTTLDALSTRYELRNNKMVALPDTNLSEHQKAFKTKLTQLYELAKKNIKGDHYGLSKLEEFVTEAFANIEFQKELAKIKTGTNKKSNIFQDFLSSISNFFNTAFNIDISKSLLEEVFEATAEYLEGTTSQSINAKYAKELAAVYDKYDKLITPLLPGSETTSTSDIETKKADLRKKIEYFNNTIEPEFEEGDYAKVLELAEKQVKDGKIRQTAKNVQLISNYPKLFEEFIKATDARNKTIEAFDKEAVLAGNPNKLPIYNIEVTLNENTKRLEIKWVEVGQEAITNIQLTKLNNYAASELLDYKVKLQEELDALEKATPAPKTTQTNTTRRGIIDQNFDSIVEQLKNAGMPVFINEDNLFKKC